MVRNYTASAVTLKKNFENTKETGRKKFNLTLLINTK